jgi:hypothetical protein
VTIAGAGSWVIGANRRQILELARPMMPRARTHAEIRRRMEKITPYIPHRAKRDPLAVATDAAQRALGRGPKGGPIGRR